MNVAKVGNIIGPTDGLSRSCTFLSPFKGLVKYRTDECFGATIQTYTAMNKGILDFA